MKTLNRTATAALIAGLSLAGAWIPAPATAQTPAQMEYERQQREYRLSMERQQQEQLRMQQLQQDNARRQQDEQRRSVQSSLPKTDYGSSPATSASPSPGRLSPARPAADPLRLCKSNPLRNGERNPLLGRWQPRDAPKGDAMTQLFQSLAAPQCMPFAMGIEFRERALVTTIAPAPAHYGHRGDEWYVCLPESATGLLRFRVDGPDQVVELGSTCRLARMR